VDTNVAFARFFRIFGDPTRLAIIRRLLVQPPHRRRTRRPDGGDPHPRVQPSGVSAVVSGRVYRTPRAQHGLFRPDNRLQDWKLPRLAEELTEDTVLGRPDWSAVDVTVIGSRVAGCQRLTGTPGLSGLTSPLCIEHRPVNLSCPDALPRLIEQPNEHGDVVFVGGVIGDARAQCGPCAQVDAEDLGLS
jgi:hypothetical protein